MYNFKGIQFDDTIRVLFSIKEKKGHKTLQETYEYLQQNSIDSMLDVVLISYNVANKSNLDDAAFADILADKGLGFAVLADLYGHLVDSIMLSGMSKEDLENRKKTLLNPKSK